MRLQSGEGRRQAIAKGIRALQREKFIADIQEKLASYQRVLDTRILVGLKSHSLQQVENFKYIGKSVKDLATALGQGHDTVTELLAEQRSEIRKHIDRRFDNQALLDQELKARAQFKETLLFPELYSRQENIPVAYEGTCQWIFTDTGRDEKMERQPWPNLADWFEHGTSVSAHHYNSTHTLKFPGFRLMPYLGCEASIEESSSPKVTLSTHCPILTNPAKGDEPYWLSGKPGSGKSTLMKYITEEFWSHLRNREALNSKNVVASFFFWKPGSVL